VPQAPTSASQGLTNTPGSGSIGRAPSRNSRVKQSCTLLKPVSLASLRSRSENSRHKAIQQRTTQGCSIRLNHPTNCVRSLRGIRLVSRKLMSSCWTIRAIRAFVVISVSFVCNRVRRLEGSEVNGDEDDHLV